MWAGGDARWPHPRMGARDRRHGRGDHRHRARAAAALGVVDGRDRRRAAAAWRARGAVLGRGRRPPPPVRRIPSRPGTRVGRAARTPIRKHPDAGPARAWSERSRNKRAGRSRRSRPRRRPSAPRVGREWVGRQRRPARTLGRRRPARPTAAGGTAGDLGAGSPGDRVDRSLRVGGRVAGGRAGPRRTSGGPSIGREGAHARHRAAGRRRRCRRARTRAARRGRAAPRPARR